MQKLVNHPLTVVIFTVLAVIFYFSLEKSAKTAETSVSTLQSVQQETEKLNQEVEQLHAEVAAADTALAKEKIIRNELLLQKPGEYVIQLTEFSELEPSSTTQTDSETPWQKWKKILLL